MSAGRMSKFNDVDDYAKFPWLGERAAEVERFIPKLKYYRDFRIQVLEKVGQVSVVLFEQTDVCERFEVLRQVCSIIRVKPFLHGCG